MTRTRAVLATARTANLPGVVTNVLAGAFAATLCTPTGIPSGFLLSLYAPCLSGICFYLAGNFLNDWKDAGWDQLHRPERAIPRGLVRRTTYLAAACCFFAAAFAAATTNPAILPVSAFLTANILLYTAIHKSTALGILPMALCRCCLIALGWSATCPQSLLHPVPTLLLAGQLLRLFSISLAARRESLPPPHRQPLVPAALAALSLVPTTAATLAALHPFGPSTTFFPAPLHLAILPAIWIMVQISYKSPSPGRFVGALLAGLPLFDLILTAPAALLLMQAAENPAPWLAALGLLPALAFPASLALQRLAPAT